MQACFFVELSSTLAQDVEWGFCVFRAHTSFSSARIFLTPLRSLSFSNHYDLFFSLFLSISLYHSLSIPFELPLEGHPLPRTACPRIHPGVAVSSRAASARASLAIVGPRVRKTGRFSSSSSSSSRANVWRVNFHKPVEKNRVNRPNAPEIGSMFSCEWIRRARGNVFDIRRWNQSMRFSRSWNSLGS